jgi:hypothetical protein
MARQETETSDTGVATNDAYTGMLVISLLALIAGSVLLYLDYSQYPPNPPKAQVPSPPAIERKGDGAPAPPPGGGIPQGGQPQGGVPGQGGAPQGGQPNAPPMPEKKG